MKVLQSSSQFQSFFRKGGTSNRLPLTWKLKQGVNPGTPVAAIQGIFSLFALLSSSLSLSMSIVNK